MSNNSANNDLTATQQYLRQDQAAARYGVHRDTLRRNARLIPNFPQPIRFGRRAIGWNVAELDAWFARQTNTANAQGGLR